MKKLVTGLLVLGSFSSLAQDLTITNSTYPEQKIDLYCQDVDCSKILVGIHRQMKSKNPGQVDDIVENFEVDKSTIEGTVKNRRKFSKFQLKNMWSDYGPYEMTTYTAEGAATAFKEGAYFSSAATSLILPFLATMETGMLPFETVLEALEELARNKRVDESSEKRAARRILKNLINPEVQTTGYKHVKYLKIRDYISKIAKLTPDYLALVDNNNRDFVSEFNYQAANCVLKYRYQPLGDGEWEVAIKLFIEDEEVEQYSARENVAEAAKYIESGECKTKI